MCKIGDVVQVVPREVVKSFKRHGWGYISPSDLTIPEEMLEWCGELLTIKERSLKTCWFKVVENDWVWDVCMFEPPYNFDDLEDLL